MLAIAFMCVFTLSAGDKLPSRVTMSRATLMDKIKGAWAGQVLGCTYGGPTEFQYRSRMIPDSREIPWGEPDYVAKIMKRVPTLYDDIYMDLTFVAKIGKKRESITNSYERDFLEAARRAMEVVKYNLSHI